MSIPRVGSSMTTTRGSSCIIFANRSFCWLPPDIWPASKRPALKMIERRQRQVGRDRFLEQQAFALAVLGQIDGACAHAGARVRPLLRRAAEPDFAAALAQPE